jgi:ABC-type polysaccharide/polyol phosphate export permease
MSSLAHLRTYDKYFFQTAWILARNGITRQYRDSYFGMLWMVVQPLTMIFVYSLVVPRTMGVDKDYYVQFLVSSLLLWQFIGYTLAYATKMLLANAEGIKRCTAPLVVFPVAEMLRATLVYFGTFAFIYVLGALFVFTPSWHVLLLPLFLIPTLIVLTFASIAIAFATPYIRDLHEGIHVAINIFFWLTPVVYPVSKIPAEYLPYFEFNPFYIMIRPAIALVHEHRIPGLGEMLPVCALAALTVALSVGVYKLCRRNFIFYI